MLRSRNYWSGSAFEAGLNMFALALHAISISSVLGTTVKGALRLLDKAKLVCQYICKEVTVVIARSGLFNARRGHVLV
jgi:hypothetical protein